MTSGCLRTARYPRSDEGVDPIDIHVGDREGDAPDVYGQYAVQMVLCDRRTWRSSRPGRGESDHIGAHYLRRDPGHDGHDIKNDYKRNLDQECRSIQSLPPVWSNRLDRKSVV